jgi:lysyl endopeptidase
MKEDCPRQALRIATVLLCVTATLIVLPRPRSSVEAQGAGISVSSMRDTRDVTTTSKRQRVPATRQDLPSARRGIAVETIGISNRLAPLNLANHRKSKPNEIGVVRSVDLSSAASTSRLILNADGSRIRLLSIESPGAVEMRVHLSDFDLPDGDEVYFYGLSEKSQVFGPYRNRGLIRTEKPERSSSSGFWSNTVAGDTIVIEHLIRGDERPFSVSKVLHNYAPFLTADPTPNLLNCHNDAKCVADVLNNAVARISFIKDNSAFFCSATMMNNQQADSAPYVLTANHCVSDQGVAFSVEALWFFTSTQCNSNVPGPGILSPVGDHTLLRMLSGVPDGLTFSGWATVAVGNGAGVFGLHHPDASFLRRSTGSVIGTNTGCPTSGVVGGYRVSADSGIPAFCGCASFERLLSLHRSPCRTRNHSRMQSAI